MFGMLPFPAYPSLYTPRPLHLCSYLSAVPSLNTPRQLNLCSYLSAVAGELGTGNRAPEAGTAVGGFTRGEEKGGRDNGMSRKHAARHALVMGGVGSFPAGCSSLMQT